MPRKESLPKEKPLVLTIGHSTRPLAEFIAFLAAHQVTRLVDVRTVPRSRTNPQFNKDSLPEALRPFKIKYVHLVTLGGLRKPRKDSPNAGWRNLSFRGYADYMQTPAFAEGLAKLLQWLPKDRPALMCAEAVPWRCHRSMIADALLVRGIPVEEILSLTRRQPHKLTPFAKVRATKITYPPYEPAPAPARGGTLVTRESSAVGGRSPRRRRN